MWKYRCNPTILIMPHPKAFPNDRFRQNIFTSSFFLKQYFAKISCLQIQNERFVNESITAFFFKGPAPFRSAYLSCIKAFIFFLLCITDRGIWIGGGIFLKVPLLSISDLTIYHLVTTTFYSELIFEFLLLSVPTGRIPGLWTRSLNFFLPSFLSLATCPRKHLVLYKCWVPMCKLLFIVFIVSWSFPSAVNGASIIVFSFHVGDRSPPEMEPGSKSHCCCLDIVASSSKHRKQFKEHLSV